MTKFLNISTDSTLGGENPFDHIVVSQKAIKLFVGTSISTHNTDANAHNTLFDAKQDVLTAGTGIDINQNTNTISTEALVIKDYS